ncbi:hypothetical protein Ddc_14580 [Ditylenchus destructor]|nr:hypothetical protein Ddc_14580 [Ditylenchus destructor]
MGTAVGTGQRESVPLRIAAECPSNHWLHSQFALQCRVCTLTPWVVSYRLNLLRKFLFIRLFLLLPSRVIKQNIYTHKLYFCEL